MVHLATNKINQYQRLPTIRAKYIKTVENDAGTSTYTVRSGILYKHKSGFISHHSHQKDFLLLFMTLICNVFPIKLLVERHLL